MQDKKVTQKYLVLCFLYLTLFSFTAPKSFHMYDSWCFSEWSKHIFLNGLGNIYDSGTDYLPILHYFLKIYVLMQDTTDQIWNHIHLLKIFSIIFLLITGYYMLRIFILAGLSKENLIYNSLFLLLNLGVLYNCFFWNQVDIILGALIFMSAYFAFTNKTLLSLVFILFALNFKLHAIIFIPVIGLIVLPEVVRSLRSGRIFLYLAVLSMIQFLIVLPFILDGTANRILEIAFAAFDKYPFVSYYAYNAWHLMVSGNLKEMHDTIEFLGLTYKQWGLILFFVSSGIALIPLMKQCYYRLFPGKNYEVPLDKVLIIFTLIPLLFFYFNTQMHERYSHPALAFLITYCVIKKQPILGLICSLAYLLNLEEELKYLQLPKYGTLIFDPVFIALLYLASIIWLFVLLFRKTATAVQKIPING